VSADSPAVERERLGFLAAARNAPDDDVHRLAYADWLEEGRGGRPDDPARGAFIRAQVAQAAAERAGRCPRLPAPNHGYLYAERCRCPVCRARRAAARLLLRHAAAWRAADLGPATPPDVRLVYARGLPGAVVLPTWRVCEYLPGVVGRHPIARVVVTRLYFHRDEGAPPRGDRRRWDHHVQVFQWGEEGVAGVVEFDPPGPDYGWQTYWYPPTGPVPDGRPVGYCWAKKPPGARPSPPVWCLRPEDNGIGDYDDLVGCDDRDWIAAIIAVETRRWVRRAWAEHPSRGYFI
jgi:uncharacterized protein (TIGR02996 family)